MDYTGLYAKQYRINRKLTDEERSSQLHQKVRVDAAPFHNPSIIKMNSTYLECVDRWFFYRGEMTAACLLAFVISVSMIMGPLYMFPPAHLIPTRADLHLMLFAFPFVMPLWVVILWLLLKESFRWTHFPLRFNYRERMVYVFRPNGSVLEAKWDKLFFTLGRCERRAGGHNWDIRGHMLDKDGETVRATFALPGDSTQVEQLRHGWEFFRRYMEEGPASVYRDVYWCHDITEQRESYRAGLKNLFFPYNGFRPFDFPLFCLLILRALAVFLSPFLFVASIGRWFAMRTSKIPVWPAEVEAQCAVDAFDPYRRDASHNPQKIPKETIRNG